MIFRNCAGGVVFCGDKVFLLRNEKEEWVLPKGVIRDKRLAQDVALDRVFKEAGIKAQIISPAGQTSYEFYSITRHQPVCNRITWYVMRADTLDYRIAFEQGFTDGDYFPFDAAMDKITYSQDKALVSVAYEKYKSMEK
ncbi:MAG TPA: NUDIX hydrolase [Candidatus Excrementavichristensenella intestinipullorum]|nr:NUDIX hydrolase [Candidatus Excrementavichristensenella intestinipullorum]